MNLTTSLETVELKSPPTNNIIELKREPESIFVVVEFGRRNKTLIAFRSEELAKRHLSELKEYNANFANPPPVIIKCVDLY